jgi:hypothetical protein
MPTLPLVFIITNKGVFVTIDVSSYVVKPEAYNILLAY